MCAGGGLTRDGGDGGTMAFREADSGGNCGISGGAAGAAHGRGRDELDSAELRWPLRTAGGFVEEKWRVRGGGSRLSDGEARRGKERGGGSGVGGATRRKEGEACRQAGRAASGGGRRSAMCEQGRGGWRMWAMRVGVGWLGEEGSWVGP
jgi:hypothetical protein